MSEQPGGSGMSDFPVCVVPPARSSAWETWAAQGGGLVAREFWLDPEAARECVNQMRQALDELGDLRTLLDPVRVVPKTADEVSREFVRNSVVAVEGAQTFFVAWREQLAAAIMAMESQIKSYEDVEEQNRRRYT